MSSLTVIGFLLCLSLAFYAGLYIHDIKVKLDKLLAKPEIVVTPVAPAVTMGGYGVTNENAVNLPNSSVGVATVKSPQLLEFEEQEEIRKINLRPQ